MEKVEDNTFNPESIEGVKALGSITGDERFATWRVERGGVELFLKHAKNDKSRHRLANEVWGNRTMAQLSAHPEAPFRVAQIVEHNKTGGWFLAEFIPGKALSPGDYERSTVMNAEPTMLTLYAYLDQAIVPEPSYSPARFGSSKNAEELDAKIRSKFATINQALSKFDGSLIEDSLLFIHQSHNAMKPAFAHGDLTPKHVMRTGKGKPYIIDFESCSLYWPRFYELMNYATKLNVVHSLVKESDAFISKFFETAGVDPRPHDTALKVVAAVRSLLIIHELAAKPTNQRIYHTELKPEHQDRVSLMLKRCLSDKPLFQIF